MRCYAPMLAAALAAAALLPAAHAVIPPGGVPDVVTFESGTVMGVRMPTANVRVSGGRNGGAWGAERPSRR
jgi:hypothetical protein